MRQQTLFDDIFLTSRCEPEEALENLQALKKRGYVIGTDEAGRGALAGPVVAAAVYLTEEQEEKLLAMRLRDSKLMTPLSREKVFMAMNEMGVLWRAFPSSVEFVDRVNILQASLYAMRNSVERVSAKLETPPACVIADGNQRIPNINYDQWILIKADKMIPVVSAASVVAKVLRDRIMKILSAKYPGYDLEKNKGYGTKAHMQKIKDIGMSEIHRKTFCKGVNSETCLL